MDVTCSHCGNAWDAYGLRHESWDYLDDAQAHELGLFELYWEAGEGDVRARRTVSCKVYEAVLSGRGCPLQACGFKHEGTGKFRDQQLYELVMEGVTDEDPFMFM